MSPKAIGFSIVGFIGFVLILILNPYVQIEAGHRGVVTELGKVSDTILTEGPHWRTPFFQSVREIDVRSTKIQTNTAAYTKDSQPIGIEGALQYRLDDQSVNILFKEIGLDYQSKIIDPAVQEAIKVTVAGYTAQEILDKRAEVKDKILAIIKERVGSRHIIAEDYAIINFEFSDAYEASVEAKQVAQQNALKAENDLARVEFEAAQRIAEAEAEAEAIRIQANAINSQGGEDYVNLKAIEKWNGQLPTQFVPGSAVPFLSL